MSIIPALPYTLVNGQTADASQVMADFNTIVNGVNANGAANGNNSDITQLSGLTTPLTPAQGGTQTYVGGTSSGTANAQVINPTSPTNFSLQRGNSVIWIPGFSNTSAFQINVAGTGLTNCYKPSAAGPVACTGGEVIVNQVAQATYDGTQFVLVNPVTAVSTPAPTSVVGAVANLLGVKTSAQVLTFTYDALVYAASLTQGASVYQETGGNHALNAGSVGAGGMDTGSPPVSGFVAVYAITKGDNSTFALLGTTASSGSVYSGGNMPAGYVGSALIGVWPTDGSRNFIAGTIENYAGRRFIPTTPITIVTGATVPASMTSQSISAGVPASAKTASFLALKSGGSNSTFNIAGSTNYTGMKSSYGGTAGGAGAAITIFGQTGVQSIMGAPDIPILTSQTVYWQDGRNDPGVSCLYVTDYTF